jgi:hypothetical protein
MLQFGGCSLNCFVFDAVVHATALQLPADGASTAAAIYLIRAKQKMVKGIRPCFSSGFGFACRIKISGHGLEHKLLLCWLQRT